jgi:hypothetical protein
MDQEISRDFCCTPEPGRKGGSVLPGSAQTGISDKLKAVFRRIAKVVIRPFQGEWKAQSC